MKTRALKLIADTRAVLSKANEAINVARAKRAEETKGILRGAMGGAIVEKGTLSAKCPRLDQARLLGIESQNTPEERIMFSAGLGHEVFLETQFKAAGIEFKKEEAVEGVVDGRPWHGTPDFQILLDGEWVGVEAKALVSNFSLHKQVQADMPFMKHVLQAAGYMIAMQREVWLIAIGNYFYGVANGNNYEPDIRWYVVTFNEKSKHFEVINESGEPIDAGFGVQNVLDYLRMLNNLNDAGILAERPIEQELGTIKVYDRCNYCPLQSDCNAYDTEQISMTTWLTAVGRLKKKAKAKRQVPLKKEEVKK